MNMTSSLASKRGTNLSTRRQTSAAAKGPLTALKQSSENSLTVTRRKSNGPGMESSRNSSKSRLQSFLFGSKPRPGATSKRGSRRRKKINTTQGTSNNYEIRNDLFTGEKVQCLAFEYPLINFTNEHGEDFESDCNSPRYLEELAMNPATAKAKKKWKRLYEIIMDKRSLIPLKQMALKAKHEQVIFDSILKKWTLGKSISTERRKLATLNENMRFKGGPTDRKYARRLHVPVNLLSKNELGKRRKNIVSTADDGQFHDNIIQIRSMILDEIKQEKEERDTEETPKHNQ